MRRTVLGMCVIGVCSYVCCFVFVTFYYFFFFKQRTAYEMRISDWSSDVCSSDLVAVAHALPLLELVAHLLVGDRAGSAINLLADRSEERRVGKECVSTCRSRWSPSHSKKTNILNMTEQLKIKQDNRLQCNYSIPSHNRY